MSHRAYQFDFAISFVHILTSYRHIAQHVDQPSALFSNTLPLVAMFMRNKLLSWVSVFTALQMFLNEPKTRKPDAQPAWVAMVTAFVGLITCYMDFVMPKRLPPVRQAAETTTTVAAAITAAVTGA